MQNFICCKQYSFKFSSTTSRIHNPSFKTNKLCAFPAQKRRHVDALSYCRCVTTDRMYGGVRDDEVFRMLLRSKGRDML